MPYALVRHKVEDYARWKPVFDDDAENREAGGLPRLGNSPDLLHKVEGVIVNPLFLDLAPGDAVDEDAGYVRLIAGRSVSQKLTLVGAASPPASNHPVTFGYQVLNRNT